MVDVKLQGGDANYTGVYSVGRQVVPVEALPNSQTQNFKHFPNVLGFLA